jgi:hypothetical protein
MGSYAYLRIGDIQLGWTKDGFDPSVMMFFSEKDKRVLPNSPANGAAECDDDLEEGPSVTVQYAISIAVARDRLEFMGFTLSRVRQHFQSGIEERRADLSQRAVSPPWTNTPGMKAWLDREREVVDSLTFEKWVECLSYIVGNRLQRNVRYWLNDEVLEQQLPLTVCYMLGRTDGEILGFPSGDLRDPMRAIVEVMDSDREVVYDLTDLVDGQCVEAEDDLCAYARRDMAEGFLVNHKVVVLTEGNVDKRVLEGALELLYPHLAEYYSFMDFDSARAPGGASALVATVKAFIGAGIVNRIVALFDNDTAARSAMRALDGVTIPENVRVLRYPDASSACNYPTLGPQGTVKMNINGLAGSIELYFGHDVLLGADGNLTPVQWRGYDERLRDYQGEMMSKAELQSRFSAKLQACRGNPSLISDCDWGDIRLILDALRAAFNDQS